MKFSAQYGTGQGNDDEHPSHPNSPAAGQSESSSKSSLPPVFNYGNRSPDIVYNDRASQFFAEYFAPIISPDTSSKASEIFRNPWSEDDDDDNHDSNENDEADNNVHTYRNVFNDKNDEGGAPIEWDRNREAYNANKNDNTEETKKRNDDKNEYPTMGMSYLDNPRSLEIEPTSENEFSEDNNTPLAKYLRRISIAIKDEKGEIDAVSAILDTGAYTSGVSEETVKLYGLKQRPLMEADRETYRGLVGNQKFRPETWVQLYVKCKKIGFHDWVLLKARVLEGSEHEIILGMPFIGAHDILANLPEFDRSGKPLFVLKGGRSKAQKAYDHAITGERRKEALALERMKTISPSKSLGAMISRTKDTESFSQGRATMAFTGFDSTRSAASWPSGIDWHTEKSSLTSWATKTDRKESGDDSSFVKHDMQQNDMPVEKEAKMQRSYDPAGLFEPSAARKG